MSELVPRVNVAELVPNPEPEDPVFAKANAVMHAWMRTKTELTLRNYASDLRDLQLFLGADSNGDAVARFLACDGPQANMIADAYIADLMHRPLWRSKRA